MATEIRNMNQLANVLRQKTPDDLTVIKFYFTWCGHCQNIEQWYDDLSAVPQLGDVTFLSVDIDQNGRLAKEVFGVSAGPTFLLLRGDDVVDRVEGADRAKILKAIAAHL